MIKSWLTPLKDLFVIITGHWFYPVKKLPVGTHLEYFLKYKTKLRVELIFDIGANVGHFSKNLSRHFPVATIYSFEPVPSTFALLEANIKSKYVKLFKLGFGDENSSMELDVSLEEGSTTNSLIKKNQLKTGKIESIDIVTLDTFVIENKIKKIDLLKIDTEGYELKILEGGRDFLKSGLVSFVYVEVGLSSSNTYHIHLSKMIDTLEQMDFHFIGLFQTNSRHIKFHTGYSNALFVHNSSVFLLN